MGPIMKLIEISKIIFSKECVYGCHYSYKNQPVLKMLLNSQGKM